MGSGSSRSKVTTPVTPWSYSPEPGTPDHDRYHQRTLNSAQRLDQIARLVAQQEPFHQHPGSAAQRLTSAQRLDQIARLVAQQEPYHQHPTSAQRLDAIARLVAQQEPFHQNIPSLNGHRESDRYQVPLYIQPSTPLKPELSDLQEMQDLQKTFDSLGIPETRIDEREERWVGLKEGHLDVGRVFGPRPDSVEDEDADRVSSTSSVNSEPKSKSRVYKIMSQKSVSAPTSLHKWDPKSDVSSEEWTYSKKEIDGFDPDKFRRVNKAKNVSTFVASYRASPGTTTVDAPHPHSVPNYDETEERIVGSIEREYSY